MFLRHTLLLTVWWERRRLWSLAHTPSIWLHCGLGASALVRVRRDRHGQSNRSARSGLGDTRQPQYRTRGQDLPTLVWIAGADPAHNSQLDWQYLEMMMY